MWLKSAHAMSRKLMDENIFGGVKSCCNYWRFIELINLLVVDFQR